MKLSGIALSIVLVPLAAQGLHAEPQEGGGVPVYNYHCTMKYMTQNGFDPFPRFYPRTVNVSGWTLERTVANGCIMYLMRMPKTIGDYIESVRCTNLKDPRESVSIDYGVVRSEFWGVLDGLISVHRGARGDRDLAADLERLKAVGNPEVCVPGTPLY